MEIFALYEAHRKMCTTSFEISKSCYNPSAQQAHVYFKYASDDQEWEI